MKAEGFEIEIPETALANLRDRLAQARFAADFANEDWSYGANAAYLRDLMAYWRDGFDWRARNGPVPIKEIRQRRITNLPSLSGYNLRLT